MGRLVGYDTQRNNHGGKRNSSTQLTYRIQLAMVSESRRTRNGKRTKTAAAKQA